MRDPTEVCRFHKHDNWFYIAFFKIWIQYKLMYLQGEGARAAAFIAKTKKKIYFKIILIQRLPENN